MLARRAAEVARSHYLVSSRSTPDRRNIHTSVRPLPDTPYGSWKSLNRRLKPPAFAVSQRRTFIQSLPSILVPPVVFTGLLLSLWAYKCLMTVLFQDKIIYMPYMPPFTRSEKVEDYAASCRPVEWTEHHIRSLDGTKLALGVGRIPSDSDKFQELNAGTDFQEVVICYFHGNGGSVPPRTPLLSNVLRHAQAAQSVSLRYTLIALSYRGYWASSGRASESGIKLDAQALLRHVQATQPKATVILWGQSLGAGVACTAAAEYIGSLAVAGLVLETPFTSIKAMLLALYPQKWLPYQYLHPFLWNHWDSEKALKMVAQQKAKPRILLLSATRDEIVPAEEIGKIEEVCREKGLETQRTDVIGSLHNEATTRREGQEAVARFVIDVAKVLLPAGGK